MDELDRSLVLYRMGLRSECLGPPVEWDPKSPAEFQRRHTTFWEEVAELIEDEPGEYEDLPNWMTEEGSEALEANN
jgi:hypothetical protein